MTDPALLSDSEIEDLLRAHPDWARRADRLERTYEFADFSEAFGFMTRVAMTSERLFHHPEWSNVWNRVNIAITDHEVGGISNRDLEFVERVDTLTS
jgi:4a-hydroxytetrahydrobiopterin dehydratase